mgnify:CR=1 FL=1
MTTALVRPRVLVDLLPAVWLRDLALVVGGTAAIALSAQVSIPLWFTPVPLTFQTLAVLATGAALGTWRSLTSTALYLVAAVAGLPVLAPKEDGGHVTGSAVFAMPSLGYVLGFIVAGALVGKLAEAGFTRTPLRTASAMVLGNLAIYAIGVPVLKLVTGADWASAVSWGLTPFIIGDLIKVAIAAGAFPAAWALVRRINPAA